MVQRAGGNRQRNGKIEQEHFAFSDHTIELPSSAKLVYPWIVLEFIERRTLLAYLHTIFDFNLRMHLKGLVTFVAQTVDR